MKFLGTFNYNTQKEEINQVIKNNPTAKGFRNPYGPTVSFYAFGTL